MARSSGVKFFFCEAHRKVKAQTSLLESSRIPTSSARVLRQELKQSIPEPRTDLSLPEEISEGKVFYEGTRKQISVNAYERSPIARRVCLEHYGTRCTACAQDMSETYGAVAAGLIHIHHLKPLSELQEGYEVNPIEDLCPVCPICPNCHAVIHRSTPPYTIEEVKDFLEKERKNRKENL